MNKESYFGNIEYKRFIKYNNSNNKKNRKDSLISQLKYRLKEGSGICEYNIGVEDNGEIININEADYNESLKNIKEMTESIDSHIVSIKKIESAQEKYYYNIIIHDNITNDEYRILNICNSNNIELIGIDNNNNLLKLEDNTVYDIKKNAKTLLYVKNIQDDLHLIKNILTFKPHIIHFNENYEATFKLLTLLKKLEIPYKFNNLFEKPIYIYDDESKSQLTLFHTLFNGNILNNNKIYAFITNKKIDNLDNLYLYMNSDINKFNIIELQHINQIENSIDANKLISLSTNLKITGDYHICNSNKCDIKYTNIISYENNIEFEIPDIEYTAYYKNNILNVKFYKDHIKLNKNVYLDEKYFIIDVINCYILINIF
jgi:hypothetical protein